MLSKTRYFGGIVGWLTQIDADADDFDDYRMLITHKAGDRIGALLMISAILLAPFDFLHASEETTRRMLTWRVWIVGLGLLVLLYIRYGRPGPGAHVTALITGFLAMAVATGVQLSTINATSTALASAVLLLPIVTIPLLLSLPSRIAVAVLFPTTYGAPFLLAGNRALTSEYLVFTASNTLFSIAISVALGLAFQDLVRRNFNYRKLEEERAQGLEFVVDEQRERIRDVLKSRDTHTENERRRIAREIHDRIGQHISLINFEAAVLRDEPDAREQDIQKYATIIDQCQQMIVASKEIVHDLWPAWLERRGILSALEVYVDDWNRTSSLPIRFNPGRADAELPVEIGIAIYRVVQELCTNALKHSGAREILISAEVSTSRLILIVRDDGRGINPAQANQGLGLLSMRERVVAAAGVMEWLNVSKGSAAQITIPLPTQEQVESGVSPHVHVGASS